MNRQSFFNIINGRAFQLSMIILTGIYSAIILVILDEGYHANEQVTKILPITKKMEQFANAIRIGLHIESFPYSHFERNEFVMDAVVWFQFPLGTESLETIEHFCIDNSILQNNGELLFKSEPNIKLIGDDVIVAYNIQTKFKSALDHRRFPIGDHKLNIMIYNKYASPYELVFTANKEDFTFSNNFFISSWQRRDSNVMTGYCNAGLHAQGPDMDLNYPAAVFSIDFESVGIQELLTLYFPMFVIFFIGLSSMFISVVDLTRLTFIASSVPILVLFRIVIDSAAPVNIGYTTHIDYVFYLLVFLSLIILLFQSYVTLVMRDYATLNDEGKKILTQQLMNQNSIILLFSLASVILFMTYSYFSTLG